MAVDPEYESYLAQQLHYAARRYCMEWYEHWCDVSSKTPQKGGIPYGYTDRQYDVFPRYNMLNALLLAIERVDPDSLGDLSSAREMLERIGESANDPFTEKDSNEIEKKAKDDERSKFQEYVCNLTEDDLLGIEPLPYRRILGVEEIKELLERLKEGWGAGFPWFPLAGSKPQFGEAFEASHFHEEIDIRTLRTIVQELGTRRLWEIREGNDSFEMDSELLRPTYNGMEGLWFGDELTWLIYASHESTITVAGEALLAAIKKAWPFWGKRVWYPPSD